MLDGDSSLADRPRRIRECFCPGHLLDHLLVQVLHDLERPRGLPPEALLLELELRLRAEVLPHRRGQAQGQGKAWSRLRSKRDSGTS